MNADVNLELHQFIWDVLTDLAIDETFSEREAEDVRDAMGDLAEMLIDALGLTVLETQDGPDGLVLTTRMTLSK